MALGLIGSCKTISKLILQLWLLILFLNFFGLPALKRSLSNIIKCNTKNISKRFQEQKVIVVKSVRESDGIPIPAVTIAVKGKESGNGGKKQGVLCKYAKSVEEIIHCIESNTYSLSEIVFGVTIGGSVKIEEAKWTEDVDYFSGRIYTLELPMLLKAPFMTHGAFIIRLNKSLLYDLHIHDPKNFYWTANPKPGYPYVRKEVDPTELPYFYYLALTEVKELNVPDDPCNEDPDFNYKQCIKDYISKTVGCRTKWENNSYPLCPSVEDFW